MKSYSDTKYLCHMIKMCMVGVHRETILIFSMILVELAYSMKVSEKSDVYSFGVVALKVLLGIYPGDFISMISSGSGGETHLIDILDPCLPCPGAEIVDEIVVAVSVAFQCVSINPHLRPTMLHISQILSTPKCSNIETFEKIELCQLMNTST